MYKFPQELLQKLHLWKLQRMSGLAEGEEESSISLPHYALSKRASLFLSLPLFLLPDGYNANKLLEEEI